jgi:hypothetical protein
MKKPYKPPKITVYGDLTQMTQTMAMGGMFDNMMKTMRT